MPAEKNIKSNKSAARFKAFKAKSGSALFLTMMILAGMIIVALSGSYVIILGIKAAGIQSQSTRAYFAAEAGAEQIIYELRKGECQEAEPTCTPFPPDPDDAIFSGYLSGYDASYQVYFLGTPPLIFNSVGNYNNTRRSIEVRI